MYDVIFASPKDTVIDQAITEIRAKFDIEYQGTLDDYIGINIESLSNGKTKRLQPRLIDQIVQDVNLIQRAPLHSTPENSSMIL